MEADFSGYATKAGLLCSDGRTIMNGAFKHQDKVKVPLVWQHGHSDPENVLGHVLLENRDDGVYTYAFFNDTPKATHAKSLVEHKDITMLSIWANQLIERGKQVLHGTIREVSLVLSGANPGALIENVTIRHNDGDDLELDDEVIIYTGLELEHSSPGDNINVESDQSKQDVQDQEDKKDTMLTHAAGDAKDESEDDSIEAIYNSMTQKQKDVLHYMLSEVTNVADSEIKQGDIQIEDEAVRAVYENMDEEQKAVLQHMVGAAVELAKEEITKNNSEGKEMTHNVFEKTGESSGISLSHDDIKGIVADATRSGSLKDAVEGYALAHGITDIDILFPDATSLDNVPEFLKRRTEWVTIFLTGARKSPFSRIKTLHADLTMEEARAKGYVTGDLKREEYFAVSKRITVPTTIYKKQKLDRDDMVDITDFDVVTWLKGEMRMMLDEEIARAALISDGRDVSHEDKINEGNIRPIAKDHELYTTVVNVNIGDAGSSMQEVIDAIVMNRGKFRGTGQPIMFTTETYISRFQLLKDGVGRRLYRNLDELASELRVSQIVPVEVMEEESDLVAVLVNPADYVLGSDKGGSVSMFDDFDIDYNQYKYLIETRLSGALTKMKSAIVVRRVADTDVLVSPASPTFDGSNVTIVDTTGVVYKDGNNVTVTAAGSPYAVASGETMTVNATPASGYYFATSDDDTWAFTNTP